MNHLAKEEADLTEDLSHRCDDGSVALLSVIWAVATPRPSILVLYACRKSSSSQYSPLPFVPGAV